MEPNSIIVRKFIEDIILVGSEIASRNYIVMVLNNLLEEQKKKYLFIFYIKINGQVTVNEKINEYESKTLLEPLNNIFDYLFLNTSKKMLQETIDKKTYEEFKEFGLHV